MKCSICGKEFHGWGIPVHGLKLLKEGKETVLKYGEVCCPECNEKYVIPLRKKLSEKVNK